MLPPTNYVPAADNFPEVSFPSPVPVPTTAPDDEGNLITVRYSRDWTAPLEGAVTQLLNPSTWQGTDDEKRQAVIEADLLMFQLQNPVAVVDGLSPFWDDPDGADANGEPTDNTYTWSERIEDWAIAAFVASSGVPGAAAAYLTIAPRFRLLFKTGDWGGIANIFLDDELVGTVDTYSPAPGLAAVDIVVPT